MSVLRELERLQLRSMGAKDDTTVLYKNMGKFMNNPSQAFDETVDILREKTKNIDDFEVLWSREIDSSIFDEFMKRHKNDILGTISENVTLNNGITVFNIYAVAFEIN